MALSVDTPRTYGLGDINELPVLTAVTVYEGSAISTVDASGYARPLIATDVNFQGFAISAIDNTSGASGDVNVRVRTCGKIKLSVTSAVITSVGDLVYASDDGTFDLTTTTAPTVGKVARFVSAGVCIVDFEANLG